MIQTSCTVIGVATDTPYIRCDNGRVYLGQFETPAKLRCLFFMPDDEPPHGAWLYWNGKAIRYFYYLDAWGTKVEHIPGLPESPAGAQAVEGPALEYQAVIPEVTIVDDHFESQGQRWYVRGLDGFCDYAILLDSGANALRPMLAQSQDVNANLRRIFGAMTNLRKFDPRKYGRAFYDRLPELFELYWEYGLFGEFDVLPDTGYMGWTLTECQNHWAATCNVLMPVTNRLVSLTNEYDHGGNLVGTPDDYPRPNIHLCSQGSAVSDMPPPRPGWGFREYHCLKPWPNSVGAWDMYYNREGVDVDGTAWGPRKPIYLSEGPRFSEGDPNTDERLARSLAYETLAFGEGLVIHSDVGRFSQMLGPRVARCAKTALDIIALAP